MHAASSKSRKWFRNTTHLRSVKLYGGVLTLDAGFTVAAPLKCAKSIDGSAGMKTAMRFPSRSDHGIHMGIGNPSAKRPARNPEARAKRGPPRLGAENEAESQLFRI